MLILQQLFKLSDKDLECQAYNRRSSAELVGLSLMKNIPDATTIAFFRERLQMAMLIEELFVMLESYLCYQGLQA